jgi:hypothetical protein
LNFRSELKRRRIHLIATANFNFQFFCCELFVEEDLDSVLRFVNHVTTYLNAAYDYRTTITQFDLFFTTDNLLICGSQAINMCFQYYVSFVGSPILKNLLVTKYSIPLLVLDTTCINAVFSDNNDSD